MVKYSCDQSTLSPIRRIWVVMMLPDFSFHSQTLATKFLRPRSWRDWPWSSNCRSTTICVAMPAWSVPGTHTVLKPRRRRQLDGKGRLAFLGFARAAIAGPCIAALFPQRPPLRLDGGGLERFGQAAQAGLLRRCVAHKSNWGQIPIFNWNLTPIGWGIALILLWHLARCLDAFLQHLGVTDLIGQQQD